MVEDNPNRIDQIAAAKEKIRRSEQHVANQELNIERIQQEITQNQPIVEAAYAAQEKAWANVTETMRALTQAKADGQDEKVQTLDEQARKSTTDYSKAQDQYNSKKSLQEWRHTNLGANKIQLEQAQKLLQTDLSALEELQNPTAGPYSTASRVAQGRLARAAARGNKIPLTSPPIASSKTLASPNATTPSPPGSPNATGAPTSPGTISTGETGEKAPATAQSSPRLSTARSALFSREPTEQTAEASNKTPTIDDESSPSGPSRP